MKKHPMQNYFRKTISLALFSVFIFLNSAQAEDIIASAHTENIYYFQDVSKEYHSNQKQLCSDLINILNDNRSSNLNQCVAAYYLGELHCAEAIKVLNTNIDLQLDISRIQIKHLIKINDTLKTPAMYALVKIGLPSIPAVIRNLAESDGAQVRKLSLEVIERIDNDKDISALRLQKAIKAETDSKKQARLQAALKTLTETH